MLNLVWIAWKWLNLKISSAMLAKFIYWDGSKLEYWNYHWITKEVKKTSWYNIREQEFENFYKNNSFNWDEIEKWVLIEDSENSTRNWDLYFSFWHVTWTMEPVVDDSWVYMKIFITDKYDFIPTYSPNQWYKWLLKDILNSWWSYYEEIWYWKTYFWNLEILEKIY